MKNNCSLISLLIISFFLTGNVLASNIDISAMNAQGAPSEMTPEMIQQLPADVRERIAEESEAVDAATADAVGEESFPDDPDEFADEDFDELAEDDQDELTDKDLVDRTGRRLSRIEARYQTGYASSLATNLRQFGYRIFDQTTAKPSRLAVPGDDYVLGPGDRLRIRIWGSGTDAEFTGVIERDGTINVPRIGVVPLAGVSFGQVEQVIRREAEKYIQGININVSFVELRSLEIYVVGSVEKPGLHMIPAFSTVIDGLLAGGPISKTGSLRSIALYRDGRLHKQIDLYDLLLRGDREADIQLQNRDVLFVPRLNKTAAVTGAVIEEGIFEIKHENTLGKLLELSGSTLPQSFIGRIYLRRFIDNQEFLVQDIDTTKDKDWKNIAIRDGDLLEVQFLSAARPRAVHLTGHVKMPDVFQYKPGITLKDILVSPDLLRPNAMTDFAFLHRYDPKTTRYSIQKFPLQAVFSGDFDLDLAPYDRIEVLSREELGIVETIHVRGAVWNPGEFVYRPGLTLGDAVALAGGQTFGARPQRIELSRQHIIDDQVVTTIETLDMTENAGVLLQPYDYVMIPRVKDATLTRTVTIGGEVRFPGTYRVKDNERVSDLIQRAGGMTSEAYYFGAKYTTVESRRIQEQALENMINQLEMRSHTVLFEQAQTAYTEEDIRGAEAGRTMIQGFIDRMRAIEPEGRISIALADLDSFKGSIYDFRLDHGDTLHIPKKPSFVSVTGSVFAASSYLYEPNRTVGYYLNKAGGPTRSAATKNIYVLRANGEVVSAAQAGRRSLNSFVLMPGDHIVVPEDLEKVPYLRLTRDITDIIFKIATTAGIALAVL